MTYNQSLSPWVQRAHARRLPVGIGGEVPIRGGDLPRVYPRGGLMARLASGGDAGLAAAIPVHDAGAGQPRDGVTRWSLFGRRGR